jgi:hypothetical protein
LKGKKPLISTPLLTVLSTSGRTSVFVLVTLSIKLYITPQCFGALYIADKGLSSSHEALFWSSLRNHSIVQVENGGVQTKPGHTYVEMYVEVQKERGQ